MRLWARNLSDYKLAVLPTWYLNPTQEDEVEIDIEIWNRYKDYIDLLARKGMVEYDLKDVETPFATESWTPTQDKVHRLRYNNTTGKLEYRDNTGTWVELGSGSGGGSASFLSLTDTPNDYTGHGEGFVRVNPTEDGLYLYGSGQIKWSEVDKTNSTLESIADVPAYAGNNGRSLVLDSSGQLSWEDRRTAGLAGEIQFSDGNGGHLSDGKFVWDNVNKRLGVYKDNPEDTLDVEGAVQRKGFYMAYSSTSTAVNNSGVTVNFDTIVRNDSLYFTQGNKYVELTKSGWYRVTYQINWEQTTNSRDVMSAVATLNSNEIMYSLSYSYMRGSSYAPNGTNNATFLIQANAGDRLDVRAKNSLDSSVVNIIANRAWILIEKV